MSDTSRMPRRTLLPVVVLLTVAALGLASWGGWMWHDRRARPGPGLKTDEIHAMDAARQFVVNVFSYRAGANFDADFQRALAGATGDLATQVRATESPLRQQLTASKLTATTGNVKSAGVEGMQGAAIQVLVVVETAATDSTGKTINERQQRMEVSMTAVKGTWLASGLTSVGLI